MLKIGNKYYSAEFKEIIIIEERSIYIRLKFKVLASDEKGRIGDSFWVGETEGYCKDLILAGKLTKVLYM